ncbi:MAG: hypothetical protein H6Q67_885 [Firmicutes bacterium]|nr:hypothetical protein [Bacillota bacterium]
MKLTVYHDGQFWVGVLEEAADGKLRAARYIFGSEPYDWDVMKFVKLHMLSCLDAANANVETKIPIRPSNPKRLARQVAKEVKIAGVSTFAQEAIKKDFELRKSNRQELSKQLRHDLANYKRTLKVQKKKEKKRGH